MLQKHNLKFLRKDKNVLISIVKYLYWILGINHKSPTNYSSGLQRQQIGDIDLSDMKGDE